MADRIEKINLGWLDAVAGDLGNKHTVERQINEADARELLPSLVSALLSTNAAKKAGLIARADIEGLTFTPGGRLAYKFMVNVSNVAVNESLGLAGMMENDSDNQTGIRSVEHKVLGELSGVAKAALWMAGIDLDKQLKEVMMDLNLAMATQLHGQMQVRETDFEQVSFRFSRQRALNMVLTK